MATKWKEHSAMIWSIIALLLAFASLLYCLSFILHFIDFSFAKALAQLTRTIGGNA
ncbi:MULTISPECIES: hypothetical protein [Rummeliibacillus]|uniref:hypothetical protein n=1 Tax=Rummeliibacillus TaxID=648802 RepID=UPI0011747D13|nr:MULTISPECIES: hypothetical protein [Rummeliibacillus]MBB5170649.1 hypothetical protein [Rummeliibacillus stabekisii]MCM3315079.1 hypothetical protein [Rummeliibacillus stabekisii]GEL04904.1 hypothetical protein RST01_15310 [Rummeliibacillus stabekisii]